MNANVFYQVKLYALDGLYMWLNVCTDSGKYIKFYVWGKWCKQPLCTAKPLQLSFVSLNQPELCALCPNSMKIFCYYM